MVPPQALSLPQAEPPSLPDSFRAPQGQLNKQFLSIKPDRFSSVSAKFASDWQPLREKGVQTDRSGTFYCHAAVTKRRESFRTIQDQNPPLRHRSTPPQPRQIGWATAKTRSIMVWLALACSSGQS